MSRQMEKIDLSSTEVRVNNQSLKLFSHIYLN